MRRYSAVAEMVTTHLPDFASGCLTTLVRLEKNANFILDGVPCGIVSKRLKSPEGIKERFNKGADQIRRSGAPGIVAMDPTMAHNRKNVPMISRLWHQWRHFIQNEKDQQSREKYAKRFIKLAAGRARRQS